MTKSKVTKLEAKLLAELEKTTDIEQRRRILKHLTTILRQREYAKAHPEQIKERKRLWRERNPDRWRELSRNNMRKYLARKRAGGNHD